MTFPLVRRHKMRNVAGKTTTVRTLGTLIAPTSGSATVAGIPLTRENGAEIRRRIAIMPESPGLYLRLSVAENLEYFADLYKAPALFDAERLITGTR
jgi:ABC-2 type transport system ATP-binding protein